MSSKLGAFVVAVLGVCALARPTAAQESGVAEKLFREGKRLMGEGKVAEACKAFEGSFRKDAVVSTLLNLADCREKNQQYATAWGHFLDAERLARSKPDQATFAPIAKDRAAKLEGRLSYLIINVPKEANVSGLQISRNGLVVDEAEWNTDIPVDGGEYAVEGKAPGYEAWSTKITVAAEKDKKSVNVPRFRERPGTGIGADGPIESDGPAERKGPPPAARSGKKKLGVIAIAGGGAFVLGGLATGYLASSKWSDAKEVCGDDLMCDNADDRARGQDLVDAARMRGNVATVLTGVGVAAIGVGVFLWITAPSAPSDDRATSLYLSPSVAPDGVGVVFGGAL